MKKIITLIVLVGLIGLSSVVADEYWHVNVSKARIFKATGDTGTYFILAEPEGNSIHLEIYNEYMAMVDEANLLSGENYLSRVTIDCPEKHILKVKNYEPLTETERQLWETLLPQGYVYTLDSFQWVGASPVCFSWKPYDFQISGNENLDATIQISGKINKTVGPSDPAEYSDGDMSISAEIFAYSGLPPNERWQINISVTNNVAEASRTEPGECGGITDITDCCCMSYLPGLFVLPLLIPIKAILSFLV